MAAKRKRTSKARSYKRKTYKRAPKRRRTGTIRGNLKDIERMAKLPRAANRILTRLLKTIKNPSSSKYRNASINGPTPHYEYPNFPENPNPQSMVYNIMEKVLPFYDSLNTIAQYGLDVADMVHDAGHVNIPGVGFFIKAGQKATDAYSKTREDYKKSERYYAPKKGSRNPVTE